MSGETWSRYSVSSTECSGTLAVCGDSVVRHQNGLTYHHRDSVPAIPMNCILDEPVRPAPPFSERDSVAAITRDHIIDYQGVRIAQSDADSSACLIRVAVRSNSVTLNMNPDILLGPAVQQYPRTCCSSNC